jgi:WD40 repeat protein
MITAVGASGSDIVTASQNGLIRKFAISPEVRPQEISLGDQPLCSAILEDGTVVVGTANGSIVTLPGRRTVFEWNEGGWYRMAAFRQSIVAISKCQKIIIVSELKNIACFEYVSGTTPIALALNSSVIALVYSDNSLRLLDYEGIEKCVFPLSLYFSKPPIALALHPNELNVGLGSRSSRVIILEFSEAFGLNCAANLVSGSEDGFQGIAFRGDSLYCAGRSDGTVSVLSKCRQDWVFRTAWRIPNQSKATVHVQVVHDRPVVSSLIGDSIGIWDIATQTVVATFPMDAKRGHVAVSAGANTVSAVWTDKSGKITLLQNAPAISASFIGTPFHGLRGLTAIRLPNDLIVTGSCDRDVRIWRVEDGKLRCLDEVQAVDSGTHAITFMKDCLFTCGSKGAVYIWRIDLESGTMYRLKTCEICGESKRKVRITSIAVSDEFRLYLGFSDASLQIWTYSVGENELHFEERIEIRGVAVSSVFNNGILGLATTVGECYWFGRIQGHSVLHHCGVHCIRMFEFDGKAIVVSAGDDAAISLWEIREMGAFPMLTIQKGHIGGVKSVAVDVKDRICRICSFSYDQIVRLNLVDLQKVAIIQEMEFWAAISDGESVEFVDGGAVVFGAGIQFIPIPN